MRMRERGWAGPSILRLAIHFAYHLNGLVQVRLAITAHGIEHIAENWIRQGIENLVASLAVDHDLAAAQDGEVLGEVGLLNPESGLQGSGRKLSGAQGFDDGDARGMCQGLKNTCCVSPELIGHDIRVFAFSNFRNHEMHLTQYSECEGTTHDVMSSGTHGTSLIAEGKVSSHTDDMSRHPYTRLKPGHTEVTHESNSSATRDCSYCLERAGLSCHSILFVPDSHRSGRRGLYSITRYQQCRQDCRLLR